MSDTRALHDRAFRIIHGKGADLNYIELIRDLDAALAHEERSAALLSESLMSLTNQAMEEGWL